MTTTAAARSGGLQGRQLYHRVVRPGHDRACWWGPDDYELACRHQAPPLRHGGTSFATRDRDIQVPLADVHQRLRSQLRLAGLRPLLSAGGTRCTAPEQDVATALAAAARHFG